MDALEIAAENIMWTVLGALIYYLLCKFGFLTITRFGEKKKGNEMSDEYRREASDEPPFGSEVEHEEAEPLAARSSIIRGAIFLVVGIVVFGSGVYVGFQVLNAKYSCLDDYANASADTQVKRSALYNRDLDNTATLLKDIASTNTVSKEATAELVKVIRSADTVEELQDVLLAAGTSNAGDLTEPLERYVTEQEAIEKERAENPIPDPPREVC